MTPRKKTAPQTAPATSDAKLPKVLSIWSERTKTKNTPRMRARAQATIAAMTPGKWDDTRSFARPYQEEPLCAAYNGFRDIGQFRRFLVTPVFLNWFYLFRKICQNMTPFTALEVLRDDLPAIIKITSLEEAKENWPLDVDGDHSKLNKDYRLAHLLVFSQQELKTQESITLDQMQEGFVQSSKQFSEVTNNRQAPKVSNLEGMNLSETSYPGELSLEAYNRLYCMLRYLQYITCSDSLWKSKYGRPDCDAECPIASEYIPGCMRSDQSRPELVTLSDLQALNLLPSKSWTITWKRMANFKGKVELDQHLEEVEADLPSTKQTVQDDPRRLSAGAWRDSIRQQFECRKLGLNINSLHLKYFPGNDGDEEESYNLMDEDWQSMQSSFDQLPVIGVQIVLVLRRLGEGEDLWECKEPLPELTDDTKPSANEAGHQTRDAMISLPGSIVGQPPVGQPPVEQPPVDQPPVDQPSVDQPRASDNKEKSSSKDELNAFLDGGFQPRQSTRHTPSPKDFFSDSGQSCVDHHSNHDVSTPKNLVAFQMFALDKVAGAVPPASKPRKNATIAGQKLTAGEQKVLDDALDSGEKAAMHKEVCNSRLHEKYFQADLDQQQDDVTQQSHAEAEDEKYYQVQGAFGGTQQQTGFPIDLSLTILCMDALPNGRFTCSILNDFTSSEFYHYQASGALYMCAKTFGEIPVSKDHVFKDHALKSEVQHALSRLPKVLRTFGGFLRDQTGLGKTKQILLMLALSAFLQQGLPQPILLVVPASLIIQWAKEIRECWPGFTLWVCYSAQDMPSVLKKNVIHASHIKGLPETKHLPPHMRYLFDKTDHSQRKRADIMLTSFETLGNRSTYAVSTKVKNGYDEEIIVREWRTRMNGYFGIVVLDEGHRAKNRETRTHASISLLNAPHIQIASATPMQNRADILGPLLLTWPRVHQCLVDEATKDEKTWIAGHRGKDVLYEVDQLPDTDIRRLIAMDPARIARLLHHAKWNMPRIMEQFRVMEDLYFLSRSSSSVLRNDDTSRPSIRIADLLKKHHVRTCEATRKPREEAEYQNFHVFAANRFFDENKAQMAKRKAKQGRGRQAMAFFVPTAPLRDMMIANFSIILARLNFKLKKAGKNTYVSAISTWRDKGITALDIIKATWRLGDGAIQSRIEQLQFLTYGSPTLRYALHLISKTTFQKIKRNKKVLLGEALPICAWFTEMVLKHAYIGVAVMHAELTQNERSKLADEFNDPNSSLVVLILLADVSIVGLNLHESCSTVFVMTILRNLASEVQLWGRGLRITSAEVLDVYRKHTPNSHDDYRLYKQQDKVSVELATKASQPEARRLLVRLLNEAQPEVRAAHESEEGKKVLFEMRAAEKHLLEEVGKWTEYLHPITQTRILEDEQKIIDQGKSEAPQKGTSRPSRTVITPARFKPNGFDAKGQPREEATDDDLICVDCTQVIDEGQHFQCSLCGDSYHMFCAGHEKRPESAFQCLDCDRPNEPKDDYVADNEENDEEDEEDVNGDSDACDGEFVDDKTADMSPDGIEASESDGEAEGEAGGKRNMDLSQFKQLSDIVQDSPELARLKHLVRLPYDITYKDSHLHKDEHLRRALELLYAERLGEGALRAVPGIHIHYDYLHTAIGRQAKADLETTAQDLSTYFPEENTGELTSLDDLAEAERHRLNAEQKDKPTNENEGNKTTGKGKQSKVVFEEPSSSSPNLSEQETSQDEDERSAEKGTRDSGARHPRRRDGKPDGKETVAEVGTTTTSKRKRTVPSNEEQGEPPKVDGPEAKRQNRAGDKPNKASPNREEVQGGEE